MSCIEPTACCKQAASKGHAGEPGTCLSERSQAPEGLCAPLGVQVGVHDE